MPLEQHADHTRSDPLPGYESILMAVDSSDHANRGVTEAIAIAKGLHSRLTAVHVYAAKLHDARFRQMEGGLPEQFREEQELERQRDVHDDLITRGLSIITDSYLDQVERSVNEQEMTLRRRSLEGKNYRELVGEANSGDYDLLVMGALGLGAVGSSRLGSVCQRVSRRCGIDTLIIKQPDRHIGEGPIVVAVDGSSKSYGGLLTALSLARQWQTEVKAVAAFDPYYHYVAFNRIAGVLSEEAGRVFKFQEQEKLHEEIIDSGLAKIYQGHLSVARSIAEAHGMELECVLLDGKPHDVIARYLQDVNPSLLVMGTTGIHADPQLDIGGNAEYLLNDAGCGVLLSQREHQPQLDLLASVTTSWSSEAEQRMERVPAFVRPMARMAILRYAQERGHTVITGKIVEQATAELMPEHAEQAMAEIVQAHDRGDLKHRPDGQGGLRWSEQATALLLTVKQLSLRGNLSMRAEKRARAAGAAMVGVEHISPFLADPTSGSETSRQKADPIPDRGIAELHWQAAALARLMRVPEGFMRDSSHGRIEEYARSRGVHEVTLDLAEAALAQARQAMESAMGKSGGDQSRCPFPGIGKPTDQADADALPATLWSPQAETLLEAVPMGFCRDMTRRAAETIARQNDLAQIDSGFVSRVMETFQSGSSASNETMPWEAQARSRISKAPDLVRGMLIREIEGWSRRAGETQVSQAAVDAVKRIWADRGVFHLDPDDPRSA